LTETLTIRNFGPIDNVTIELRVVNILIGDQGTGKSTVAKVLAAVKGALFMNKNPDFGTWSEKLVRANDIFTSYLEAYGIINYLTSDSVIEFQDYFFHFLFVKGKITINKQVSKFKVRNEIHFRGYIPASRDAALLLKDELYAIMDSGTTLPKSLTLFGRELMNAKKTKKVHDFTGILDVSYKYSADADYVILKNGKEVLIEETSSAINSVVPMLLAFNYFIADKNNPSVFTSYIIIEEPELNCFPETQNKLMRHFISKIKNNESGSEDYYNRLLITTHSPYILTSLNNLMYGFIAGKKDAVKAKKIVPAHSWINPGDVSAYILTDKGKSENIFDRKLGQIKVEKIDSISEKLSRDWHKLADIEYAKK
jgi:hypothetical protein